MSAPLTLLASLIDYAGLFPPTSLAMDVAVRQFAAHLHGPHAALLNRFILPMGRLDEFEKEYRQLPADAQTGWRLSVLAGSEPAADLAALQDFNRRHTLARIVALETKAATPADIARVVAPFPRELEVWVEIPLQGDTTPLLRAIKASGCGAKIRTGGAATELFPSTPDVAHFLTACLATGVAFKATAGLHHPLHSHYRLTGEPGSPQVSMLGFLNLSLAAVYLHSGGSPIYALALLGDTEPAAFTATADALLWRGHAFPTAQLAAARRDFCRSFGSCSFTEPLTGLVELGWL